jgi:hypothetical protein
MCFKINIEIEDKKGSRVGSQFRIGASPVGGFFYSEKAESMAF